LHQALTAAADFTRPKFPLTGAMMQAAGMAAGPDMGVMSKALEDWWVAQGFPDATAVEAELKKRV
jgi:poly(A) polymerase